VIKANIDGAVSRNMFMGAVAGVQKWLWSLYGLFLDSPSLEGPACREALALSADLQELLLRVTASRLLWIWLMLVVDSMQLSSRRSIYIDQSLKR
jgi:hypothetical protein